ncbi:proprotein convertase P-domain-containing protein [Marinicella litoralis]|uniref:Proprotein convertase P-domain-containing protein n=1 Tax=Marinicella litoralis TaxID=644220 RepID=A0A4R6XRP0_9GAMM|nr:proprotein convertase P-domain-containing protein [Marinicella litoralis]TDR20674.1 proprotein convertase P-domain-containing protein [Marinicella litoralis]
MKKTPLIIICLFFAATCFAAETNDTVEKVAQITPFHILYQGQLDVANDVKVRQDITVTYYQPKTQKKLFTEIHKNTSIDQGVFNITLGQGQAKNGWFAPYKSMHEVFLKNDVIDLSFKVGDVVQYPMVSLKPAGHSMASSMALSGVQNNNKLHSKGYKKAGKTSAYQATVLSASMEKTVPVDTFARKTNPFTVAMNGPVLSQPLRSLPVIESTPFVDKEVNSIRHETLFDKDGNRYGTVESKQFDPLVNDAATTGPSLPTPDPIMNFAGMDNINGVLPPDIEGAVGETYYVQQVNLSTAVYSKDTGALVAGPFNTNQLWSGFGGSCQSDNSGDAIALYDEPAKRWVLTQFAVTTATSVCFAVSVTSDPTGNYYLYELPAQRFPDYYKLGVWPAADNNAYFMTTNSGQAGAYDVYAIDRESLLNGTTPRTAQFFQSYYNLLMPADVDGTLPDDTTPGYLYTFRAGGESYFTDPTNVDSLDIFEFDVDWNNPANSTLTRVQEITTNDGLADFNWTVCGFFNSDCLPQPGGVNLDSGSWWPLQRLQYRRFATHETLVGTWVVDVEAAGDRAAPRWFELNKPANSWVIAQQGTFSPDTEHRFLPSISMDASGGIGMVFSKVSSSTFASMYYTSRGKNDPPGVMRDEKLLIAGAGTQTSSSNRWGDYASMDVDPVDGCTFWMTSEHIPSTGGAPWATQIGSFSLPECASVFTSTPSAEVCTLNNTTTSFDLTLSEGFTGTTNLSVSGCPTGATCGFSSNPIVNPNNTSTLDLSGLNNAGSGDSTLVVTAADSVDSSISNDVFFNLNLFDATPGAPGLVSPTTNQMTLTSVLLEWANAGQAQEYYVELDDDPAFGSIDVSGTVSGNSFTATGLNNATCYFWRVASSNLCGIGDSSTVRQFYTGNMVTFAPELSTDVPKTITTVPNVVTSDLEITGVGDISDVNVVDLIGTHTYMGDLTFSLTSPEGTTVTLMGGACGTDEDFDINFDDEAASANFPCPPVDGGSYIPSSPLSAFDGENADGIWVLTVTDGFNADGGSLNSWGLEFEGLSDPGALTCPDLIFENNFELVLP